MRREALARAGDRVPIVRGRARDGGRVGRRRARRASTRSGKSCRSPSARRRSATSTTSRCASSRSCARPTSSSARTRVARACCSSGTGSPRKLLTYHEHNEAKRTAEVLPRLGGGRADGARQRRRACRRSAIRARGSSRRRSSGRARHGAAGAVGGRDGARRQRLSRPSGTSSSATCPRRAGRSASLWDELAAWPIPVVAFESPQRLPATLRSLADALPERQVAVCRELTKKFEEVVRGPAAERRARFAEPPKGEITLVLGPAARKRGCDDAAVDGRRRARRRRRSAPAGGRCRVATHRRVPQRALPPYFVASIDNETELATVAVFSKLATRRESCGDLRS